MSDYREALESMPYVAPTPSPMDEEVEKAAALGAQWPKLHRCRAAGDKVVELSREDWAGFKFYTVTTDKFATCEWRHCHCLSTLMVVTEIHSMEEK